MVRLALCSTFALAACASNPEPPLSTLRTASGTPVVSASAKPVDSAPGRAGLGIIESISLMHPPTSASASAGATAEPAARGPYRVTVRMDDGSLQTLIVDNRAFLVGDRVQIVADGRLIRS
jgi:hypothetical protein